MIKIIEWSTDWASDEQMKGKYLVFFNRFSIAKGKWNGFMFDIQGLGLSKAEKELKINKNKDHVTLYFLKWYFSYDRQGYKEALSTVTITNERIVL